MTDIAAIIKKLTRWVRYKWALVRIPSRHTPGGKVALEDCQIVAAQDVTEQNIGPAAGHAPCHLSNPTAKTRRNGNRNHNVSKPKRF